MRYSVRLTIQYIRTNFKKFLLLYIEITLGIALLSIGMHSSGAADERFKLMEGQLSRYPYEVEATNSGSNVDRAIPFLPEDVERLETYYGNEVTFALNAYAVANWVQKPLKIITTSVIFFSDTYYNFYGLQQGQVYMGRNLSGIYRELEPFPNNALTFNEDGLSFTNTNTTYPLDVLPAHMPERMITFGYWNTDFDVTYALILPIAYLEQQEDFPLTRSILYYQINVDDKQGKSYDIDTFFNSQNRSFTYRSRHKMDTVYQQCEDLMSQTILYTWLSRFLLVLLFIGLVGLLLQTLEKRLKNIAIALAIGATYARVFGEILLETGIMCVFCAVLAVLLTIPLIPQLETAYYVVRFQPGILLVCIMLASVIALVVCVIAFFRIAKIDIVETLQKK